MPQIAATSAPPTLAHKPVQVGFLIGAPLGLLVATGGAWALLKLRATRVKEP